MHHHRRWSHSCRKTGKALHHCPSAAGRQVHRQRRGSHSCRPADGQPPYEYPSSLVRQANAPADPSAAHSQPDAKNSAQCTRKSSARPGQSDMLLLVAQPHPCSACEEHAARCTLHIGLKLPHPLLRGCPLCLCMLIISLMGQLGNGAAVSQQLLGVQSPTWCCKQSTAAFSRSCPSAAGEGQLPHDAARLGCQPPSLRCTWQALSAPQSCISPPGGGN